MINIETFDNLRVETSRPVYTQNTFDNEFSLKTKTKTKTKSKNKYKLFDPRKFLNLFSIINLIIEYDFKNDFISDLIAGLTVGIMHVPQSLAYGALTSLYPVHGFYTSLYCGLTYVIFG
jgi:hypothetical protein